MAQRAVEDVLAEARAEIASGRFPDVIALRERLAGDADALARLDGVLAVHRARARIAHKVSDTKVSDTRSPLRTRPSVTGDLSVRRGRDFVLEWDPAPEVAAWDVRISERPDIRGDYVERETRTVDAPSLELALADNPVRVNIVGRSRTGKVVRRAIVSGLARDTWNDRWQKR